MSRVAILDSKYEAKPMQLIYTESPIACLITLYVLYFKNFSHINADLVYMPGV